MNFLKWLSIEESRRGFAGGAFGRDSQRMQQTKNVTLNHKPNEVNPTQMRMDNRFQDASHRVHYGMGIEKQIFDSLIKCGIKLRKPSMQNDMYDKIDAWWQINGVEKAIQIKYRDTGDDILFEVMKDYHRGTPGRDMISKAQFYAVLSRVGNTIVLVDTNEIKTIVQEMKNRAENEGFDQRGNYQMGNAVLKIRPDPRTNQQKLMAYIPISMLKQIVPSCAAQIKF